MYKFNVKPKGNKYIVFPLDAYTSYRCVNGLAINNSAYRIFTSKVQFAFIQQ